MTQRFYPKALRSALLTLGLVTLPLIGSADSQSSLLGGQVVQGDKIQVEGGLQKKMMRFWLLNAAGVDATTYESAFGFEVRRGLKKAASECIVQADHFACPDPKGWKFQKGDELVLTVSRAKSPFEEIKMKWPLPNVKPPEIVAAGPSYEEIQMKAKATNEKAQTKAMRVEQARTNPNLGLPRPLLNLLQAVRGPASGQAPAAAVPGGGCEVPD